MKTFIKAGAALAVAAGIALLGGCSPAGGGSAAEGPGCEGVWDLSGMEQNGETASAEDLASLKEMGMEITIDLAADGSFAFNLMGEKLEGTWVAKGTDTCELTVENETVPATVSGDDLSMEQDGAKMTFTRGK